MFSVLPCTQHLNHSLNSSLKATVLSLNYATLLEDILVSLVLIPAARWISLKKDTFFFHKFGDAALHILTIFSFVASNGATGCLSDIPLKCKLFPNKENELCLLALLGWAHQTSLVLGVSHRAQDSHLCLPCWFCGTIESPPFPNLYFQQWGKKKKDIASRAICSLCFHGVYLSLLLSVKRNKYFSELDCKEL